jgi:DNA-binding NarL/FixJ family response regulator
VLEHILIADESPHFAELNANILSKAGFSVIVVNSKEDAFYVMENYPIFCYIIDTILKDGSGFDLYYKIIKEVPHPKLIMTTFDDVDQYFEDVIKNEVSLLLAKPFKKTELLSVVKKVITSSNIFGLDNYLSPILNLKHIRITDSKKVRSAIVKIIDYAEKWNFNFENKISIQLAIQEMLTNAIYHSHGYTKQKENRENIILPDGEFVDIYFGRDKTHLGISIIDYNGKLTKEKIFHTLQENIAQEKIIDSVNSGSSEFEDKILTRGRGLDLVRKLSGEYYFNLEYNKKTEIILLFDVLYQKDDRFSSIKIFEINKD